MTIDFTICDKSAPTARAASRAVAASSSNCSTWASTAAARRTADTRSTGSGQLMRDRFCLPSVEETTTTKCRGAAMDEARMAQTEAVYREVNEAIAQTAVRFEATETDFVCECADPKCAHRITAGLDEYEDVRADATHFIVAPGHDEPDIERVVDRNGEFMVVEKFGAKIQKIV